LLMFGRIWQIVIIDRQWKQSLDRHKNISINIASLPIEFSN
jgi:hypothetical protein